MLPLEIVFDDLFVPEASTVPLDAPIVMVREGPARPLPWCLSVQVTRPDGAPALELPDAPRRAHVGNASWRPVGPLALQDFVVVDRPGSWVVQVKVGDYARDAASMTCEWHRSAEHVLRVTPARMDRSGWEVAPDRWEGLALGAYREDLLRFADQGVADAARTLGRLPDPRATDALIALLGHPREDVVEAAALALVHRVPPADHDAAHHAWSAATWRAHHLDALEARLGTVPPPPTGRARLAVLLHEQIAPIERAWAEPASPGSWTALAWHRRVGRDVGGTPQDHRILDLVDRYVAGREIPPELVLAAVDHPAVGARRQASRGTCTPEVGAHLLERLWAGRLGPGEVWCAGTELQPYVDRGLRVREAVLELAVDRVEGRPDVRAVLVVWAQGRPPPCDVPPDAAEAARWRAWRDAERMKRDVRDLLPEACR